MLRALAVALALCTLAGCGETAAPGDAGVCWRLGEGADHRPKFTAIERGVDDLETCAVLLEGLRLEGQGATDGAYQGYFLFVDDHGISSASAPHGFRYPIFQPPQRAAIDRDLKRLIAQHGGEMPSAAELAVQRR